MKIKLNLLLIICILFSATWQDAIAQQLSYDKTKYRSQHFCHNKESVTTGYCGLLNSVRKINPKPDPDVIIQAHRGVWGAEISENTREAFQQSINSGIKVLEADIMPVDVRDGGKYVNSLSGKPKALACFHDLVLERLSNGSGFIFDKTVEQLRVLKLKKPRSNVDGTGKIMFFSELLDFAVVNDAVLCVDMKSLENKGTSLLTDWTDASRKRQSLIHNLKFAINGSDFNKLSHLVIKTYETYSDLMEDLKQGDNAVSQQRLDAVLWAPMFAPSPKYQISDTNTDYSSTKIANWFSGWFNQNQAVFYYETNIFNRFDKKTSRLLEEIYYEQKYKSGTASVTIKPTNMFKAIYTLTGRRVGIFSEEPVGSRGVVNRWGTWKNKDCTYDRRGDHLWLMNIPQMKWGVITTDKPLLWKTLNNQ